MSVVLTIFTFVLILVSLVLILLVLMQRAKSDAGLGSAMGGGMAEATFGADTGNVLSKATINASIAFFVLTFLLYLGWIYQLRHATKSGNALPVIAAPAAAPAMPAMPAMPTLPASPAPASAPIPTGKP